MIFYLLLGSIAQLHMAFSKPEPRFSEKPSLQLFPGEQRLISVDSSIDRYSTGSTILRVIPLKSKLSTPSNSASFKNTLLIKAIAPGHVDLWIWKTNGLADFRQIEIVATSRSSQKRSDVQRQLESLNEAEIWKSPNSIVLKGEISSITEARRIGALTLSNPKDIEDWTFPSDTLLQESQILVTRWIQSHGLTNTLRLELISGVLWVRGSFQNPGTRKSIERYLKTEFPFIQLELNSMPDNQPTLHFQVYLFELQKSYLRSLGIEWPSDLMKAFQVVPWNISSQLSFDLTLKTLAQQGAVRILSNPQLVVRAPGEAEFFAGGELPIRVRERSLSNVIWKKHGLLLKLKVTHFGGLKTRLEIVTEFSHLNPSITQDSIPTIQTNQMSTQVDATLGKPLMLCGLVQDQLKEDSKGIPFLREIPIIGSLFGSEDYLKSRSELIAVLLPHTQPPELSAQAMDSLRSRKKTFWESTHEHE